MIEFDKDAVERALDDDERADRHHHDCGLVGIGLGLGQGRRSRSRGSREKR